MLLPAVVTVGVVWCRHATRDSIERAATGDCAADAYPRTPPYRLVPCGGPAARYRVLAVSDADRADWSCADVAGASLDLPVGHEVLCLGRSDVDPTTAMNGARKGDCVFKKRLPPRGAEPLRLDCADPRANLRVLHRRSDVGRLEVQFDKPCEGVPAAVDQNAWSWRSSDPRRAVADHTVVLCLGHKKPPPPRPPTRSPDDPDAPGSHCRFLSAAQVSAAVSATVGRRYTVAGRRISAVDSCEYRFAGGKGEVLIDMTSGPRRYYPGTGDVRLTVDRMRALWAPDEGSRVLSVWAPAGTFSAAVQLDGTGDALSRTITVALFRLARPRLR